MFEELCEELLHYVDNFKGSELNDNVNIWRSQMMLALLYLRLLFLTKDASKNVNES